MNRVLLERYNDLSLDKIYFDAVASKDKKALRNILSFKQKAANFKPGYYSGSLGNRGTVYNRAETNGIWTSQDRASAETYTTMGGNVGGELRKLAVYYERPLDLTPLGIQANSKTIKQFLAQRNIHLPEMYYDEFDRNAIQEDQEDWFTYSIIDGRNWKTDRQLAFKTIMDQGYDALILADTHFGTQSDSIVLFHSYQAKLDNLVTVDNNKIIPPSERFDVTKPDIRF